MPTNLTNREMELAKLLTRIGAVKFGAFRLKLHEKDPGAPLSPIFLNLRTPDNPKPGPFKPGDVDLAGEALYSRHCAAHCRYDAISGVPRAGEPFAKALHRIVSNPLYPLLTLGKEETDNTRRVTEITAGRYTKGDTILLVDDLITKADSKLEAICALEQAGLKVKDVLVLVDREQGGAEELAKAGYQLHAVFTLTQLLDFYVEERDITLERREAVLTYIRENRA